MTDDSKRVSIVQFDEETADKFFEICRKGLLFTSDKVLLESGIKFSNEAALLSSILTVQAQVFREAFGHQITLELIETLYDYLKNNPLNGEEIDPPKVH